MPSWRGGVTAAAPRREATKRQRRTVVTLAGAARAPISAACNGERRMSSDTRVKIEKSDAEWRSELTPEQYHVTREHGTERAFTGPHWNTKDDGLYAASAAASRCSAPKRSSIRNRLAELLRAGREARGHRIQGPLPVHDAHRNPLRRLRRASRPCLRGRTRADRPALLHERHGAEVREATEPSAMHTCRTPSRSRTAILLGSCQTSHQR